MRKKSGNVLGLLELVFYPWPRTVRERPIHHVSLRSARALACACPVSTQRDLMNVYLATSFRNRATEPPGGEKKGKKIAEEERKKGEKEMCISAARVKCGNFILSHSAYSPDTIRTVRFPRHASRNAFSAVYYLWHWRLEIVIAKCQKLQIVPIYRSTSLPSTCGCHVSGSRSR